MKPNKSGDIVKIYLDPWTEKEFEGDVKLITKMSEKDDLEYWLVEFLIDNLGIRDYPIRQLREKKRKICD